MWAAGVEAQRGVECACGDGKTLATNHSPPPPSSVRPLSPWPPPQRHPLLPPPPPPSQPPPLRYAPLCNRCQAGYAISRSWR